MGYSQVALENKLLAMYPEILDKGISPRLSFDEARNAWAVRLVKDDKDLTVFLDKNDADGCMDGNYCKSFAQNVGEAIKQLTE
jgi:hypothetical protein